MTRRGETRPPFLRAAFVCVAIAGVVALIAAASAEAAWTRHRDIAVANYVSAPKVAMDPAGDTVFMWERSGGKLYTRSRAADGTLSPIQAIGSVGTGAGFEHDLAVDPQGNAYFAWWVIDGSGFHIRARVRYADGTLSPTQTLKTASGGDYTSDPMVAVDASGRAVFTWGFTRDNGSDLIQTRSRSVSGALSPVQKVAPVGHRYYADMGVDAQGNATFVWEDWAVQEDNGLAEFTRVMAPDGELSPVERISGLGNVDSPQVAVTPSGRAIFQWAGYKSGTFTLKTRARTADGTLRPIQTLTSFKGSQIWSSQLAVAPSGEAVYCWHSGGALHERTRAAGGALSPAQTIGQTEFGYCQPGIDSQGNVAFAWSNPHTGSKDRVLARSGDAAGHLGPTQALSPAGHNANDPTFAMNPAGAAAVAWSEGGKGFAIQAAFGP